MTDQHPLTDEMCEGLMERTSKYPYTDDVIVDMRAAADWQLEQVIEWIEKKKGGTIGLHDSEINNLIIDIKRAMRP